MHKMTRMMATLAVASLSTPAMAASILLTFESAPGVGACTNVNGGNANMQCTAPNQFVGNDYGTTPELAIAFQRQPGGTDLNFRTDNNAAGLGIAAGNNATFAQIVFTPAAGHEVSFISLDNYRGTNTVAPNIMQLLDPASAIVFTATNASPGFTNLVPININSGYYVGPITFQWKSTQGQAGIDNLLLDVRRVSTGAVPEPASWAMMIAGFALVGGAARRRSSSRVSRRMVAAA